MAVPVKLEVDVELKASPDKIWTAIKEKDKFFPKVFPQQFKSIDILEGDGQSVGSVGLVKNAEGLPYVTFSKEKIEAIDEAKKIVVYTVIEGKLLSICKSFKTQLEVTPKGEGSLLKWICEFEKVNEDSADSELFKEIAIKTFKELDEFLLKGQLI